MDLQQLAHKHSTDKGLHHYMKYYDQHFKPLKDKPLHLLEIGIKKGASLRMWKEYFSKGHIYGIDIAPECEAIKEERIIPFIGSQGDEAFLEEVTQKINAPLDIVIDDGAHIADLQTISLETLFPYLTPGGLYIIEDISHTKQKMDIANLLGQKASILVTEARNQLGPIESVHFYRPDSVGSLIFIHKREGAGWLHSKF